MLKSMRWTVLCLAALATSAEGQWVELPGEGWVDLTAYYVDTR